MVESDRRLAKRYPAKMPTEKNKAKKKMRGNKDGCPAVPRRWYFTLPHLVASYVQAKRLIHIG